MSEVPLQSRAGASSPQCSVSARSVCRGTSLIRNRTSLGPYCRLMPRVLGGSQRVGVVLSARYPVRGLGAVGMTPHSDLDGYL